MTPDVEFFLFMIAPIVVSVVSLFALIGVSDEVKLSIRLMRYVLSFSGALLIILLGSVSLNMPDAGFYPVISLSAIMVIVIAFFCRTL